MSGRAARSLATPSAVPPFIFPSLTVPRVLTAAIF